jgi:hypothetical protein
MRKVVLIAGVVICSSAAAMAQNISNTRDGNSNLVRRTAPINNTPPMINSTANNPTRRPPNLAPDRGPKHLPDLKRRFPHAWAAKMSTSESTM